jgi:hypothetical protein
MACKNCAVCPAVLTATGGRIPVRFHSSIRAAVHTIALGRCAGGSSTLQAGLTAINPSRSAAFSVARIRVRLAAVPSPFAVPSSRLRAVNIACT